MHESRRDVLSWVLIGFALVLIGLAAFYAIWPQVRPHVTVKLGDGVYNATVSKTADDITKGLSGTTGLRQDQALLMVYASDGKWSIWMKDMQYPIDIVWLDKDKKVVYIVKNAPPDSYPEKFTPKKDARYVVELPAGATSQKNITIDQEAAFDENKLEGIGK
jgi:uncharacterized membrane protein (UPF0127 family)